MLFATDTYYLHYTFKGINYWLLECNYDENKLRKNVATGEVNQKVAERVRLSHMSLNQCIETLKNNDLSQTKDIILIHLSAHNSDKNKFVKEISKATGKYVVIASKKSEIILP